MIRTVIFDLDGTLADTSRDLVAAANATFRAAGYGTVLDEFADGPAGMLGGGRAMLKQGLSLLKVGADSTEIEGLYHKFLQFYADGLCVNSRLYPGCIEALERLKAIGCAMAVCTNKPQRLAEPLLAELGIARYFGAVVGADTLKVRKPAPEPLIEAIRRIGGDTTQSALVGDSATDTKTARAACVALVLVSFGPMGGEVAALDPDAILTHFDQLEDVLQGLPAGGGA